MNKAVMMGHRYSTSLSAVRYLAFTCLALGISLSVQAAERIWTGLGTDALWATTNNWDSGVPAATDTALFSGAGNGKSSVALGGTISSAGFTFNPDAVPYTIGAAGETLNLAANGTITLQANSISDQTVGATIIPQGTSYLYNNDSSHTLFIDEFTVTSTRSIYMYGSGPITFDKLQRPSADEETNNNYIRLESRVNAPITCTDRLTLGELWNYTYPLTLNLAPHTTNIFCRDSWNFAIDKGGSINGGEGTLLVLRQSNLASQAKYAIQNGTVTINVKVSAPGGLSCFSGWQNGTLDLVNSDNDIAGPITVDRGNCVQVAYLDAVGIAQPLGSGSVFNFSNPLSGSNPARLRITGDSASTSDRSFTIDQARAVIENSGNGLVTLSGPISGNGTIIFDGAGPLVYSGTRSGSGGMTKTGSGTLTLSGANSYSGETSIENGTLVIAAGGTLGTGALTLSGSAALSLNPSAAAGFSLTLPGTTLNSFSRLIVPAPVSGSSTVTIPSLTSSDDNITLSVTAPDAGVSNRIFISDLADGPVDWITLNGGLATYSSVTGLTPFTPASVTSIPTLGPGTVPDDPTGAAVIDTLGTSGPVTLSSSLTSLTLLSQEHATDALIDFGGGVLAVSSISQTTGAGALALQNGTLTANGANSNVGLSGIGTLSLLTVTDDASTGISPAKDYTHTLDFGNQTVTSINGVSFTQVTSSSGTAGGYGWSGFPTSFHNNWNSWTNTIPAVTGAGLRKMLNDMLYGGSNYSVKLTDLTPGAAYEFCLYLRTWDGQSSTLERTARFDFLPDAAAAPAATVTFDMNHEEPTAMIFRYIAVTSELTLKTYVTANTSNPYPGFFGITNEKLADAPASLETGRASLAFNAAGTAPITVSAAVADNGRATMVIKEGVGTLSLAGPVSHTGTTALNGGVLDLAPTSGVSQTFAASIIGESTIIKREEGNTLFLGANTYSGLTVVSNGILSVGHSDSLGLSSAGTVVVSGGALGLGSAQYNALAISEPISISGSGPDGLGALRNDEVSPQLYAFKDITLSDDATIGGTASLTGFPYPYATSASGRSDIRNGSLDFAGNTLAKAGPGALIVSSSDILGITDSAAIVITGGVFGLEGSTDLQGSETNTITVHTGTSFDIYQLINPVGWSMIFEDQSHLTARNNSATSQNIFSGPVTLDGTAVLDGSYHDTLSGVISGAGGLQKTSGFTHLTGTNNTYAGTTVVTGGTLLTLTANSLPAADFSRVSASGSGTLAVRPVGATDAQPGWSNAEVSTLISSGVFTLRSTALGFETVYADHTYSDALPTAGVSKFGTEKLTLSSSTSALGPVTVYDGELEMTTSSYDLDTYSITVGADPLITPLAVLHLSGTASLLPDDPGYYTSGPKVNVGSASASRGIIYIDDDASISGRLYLGSGGSNAEGAIYQTGGSFINTGGAANDARVGISGHGYYEISGGSLTNKGYTQFGVNNNNSGILSQSGGSVVFNSGSQPPAGVVGDYYGGSLAVRAGLGLFHLSGGTLDTGTSKFSLGEWSSVNSYNEGTGILTLEGDAYASVGYCELANRNGTVTSIVNLNGGDFATRYIQKGGNNNSANSRAYVNFNGGNLRIVESGTAIRTASNNSAAVLTVDDGGAFIEVDASVNTTLDLPLDPPAGNGLTYIGINSRGAGYIAPPFVKITGGSGYGASAVATINHMTGELEQIRVTSPGVGYTSNPSVSLYGGGYISAASVRDIRIGFNTSNGGLTKSGDGALVLSAENTFRGALTVSGGTLSASVPGSIPQGADLILDGGQLDLSGRTLTNASVTLSSSGALLNGSVVTTTLLKDGPGAADLTADIALAPVPLDENYGTPGLYEGRLTDRLNRTDPNPSTSVQLTTRAVNGANVSSGGTINGCLWPDNTCYVYTGYLWNRATTNVVWTFGENFDDNVYLLIDGNPILDNGSASTPTYCNVMLIPGPHTFEVRCGQGGGSVGANWIRTDGYRIGFGVDYQGRAQNDADNYEPLSDPGDGSLFTIDLPASYRDADVVADSNMPELPTEIDGNVGSLADGYALVYASDVPAQGGIINGSVGGTRYYVDNSLSDSNEFDRVAYYLELEHPTYGNQWIWVSFDAVTLDRTLIGYPIHDPVGVSSSANTFQRKVDNMDVLSNVSTITNYIACATGNIEFWPNDYSKVDALGLGGDSDDYDFGDTKNDGVISKAGHGSFQIHNWGDKTTLFAMDNWGANNSTISIGIGNQPTGSPDWTFNANGSQYTFRRLYVLTRDLIRSPKTPAADVAEGTLRLPSAAVTHPVPEDIRTKVGTAANDYDTVYASAVPVTAATIVGGTAYGIDNSAATTPFDRVAYYLELEHPSYGSQWIWVSFDAHTSDRTKLGYPSQSSNLFMWQQKVSSMDVRSNVSGVNDCTGSTTGNIEIWPSNYAPGTTGLGLGGNGAIFDYDDSVAETIYNGHGCFQIHNWGDKVTLLSLSHLGSSGSTLGLGIGDDQNPTAEHPDDTDYTFNYNAAQYTVRKLYVFVRPALLSTGEALASVDLNIESGAILDLGGATQTVHSVTGSGLVSNGVFSADTVLSPAGDGVVGTLSLSGVTLASGILYRADLGDLLDVTGAIDVTGISLQINNPEDLDRSVVYTLIQSTDGITGIPTLDTVLPSGWKLVNRGNAIRLLSEGGTLLIVR